MSLKYHPVASCAELAASKQMHVELNGEDILLVRVSEDYFAIAYYCSHEAFSLEGGEVQNGCITCPYHGAEFNLQDGTVVAPPALEPIKTYPVQVANGMVTIGMDDVKEG